MAVVAVLALTVFRRIGQSWLAQIAPRVVAVDMAWVLAMARAFTASAALAAPHGGAAPGGADGR